MKEAVGIEFKENGKVYYFDKNNLELHVGDKVIVETERGIQFGTVSAESKTINLANLSSELKKVSRKCTKDDIKQNEKNIKDAERALKEAKKVVEDLGLSMNLISATYMFDRSSLTFNFLSEGRVDFRELVKVLASKYKTRIELRQIGVRDKAREVGGLGPCGMFLCCNTFLTEFDSVSINMAKNQYLSLNPTKINGVCGRLLCCLKYEDEAYTELKKGLPNIGKIIETSDGKGKVVSINVFTREVEVELENHSRIFTVIE
jgi:cell fate regulator YaaT (PSP1 superfamily)